MLGKMRGLHVIQLERSFFLILQIGKVNFPVNFCMELLAKK